MTNVTSNNIEFRAAGKRRKLTRDQVLRGLARVTPGPIHTHFVVIGGMPYPVKEALAEATGLDPLDFDTNQARKWFRKLGFEVGRSRDAGRHRRDD